MGAQNIYIVDDDDEVRSSLHSLLSFAFEAHIHGFRSGDDFLAVADQLDPGCVLLDLHMPGSSGFDVLSAVVPSGRFSVVIITANGDMPSAISALKMGAIDFIEKPYDFSQVEASIAIAFQRLHQSVKSRERGDAAREKISHLSMREQDVLKGLIDGRSNKMIALDLQISPRTVEIYRANMMDKLHVGSLSEALRLAFNAGIFVDDE